MKKLNLKGQVFGKLIVLEDGIKHEGWKEIKYNLKNILNR